MKTLTYLTEAQPLPKRRLRFGTGLPSFDVMADGDTVELYWMRKLANAKTFVVTNPVMVRSSFEEIADRREGTIVYEIHLECEINKVPVQFAGPLWTSANDHSTNAFSMVHHFNDSPTAKAALTQLLKDWAHDSYITTRDEWKHR